MKHVIKISDYEITVTSAKLKYCDKLTDNEALAYFMNHISIIAGRAADYLEEKGRPALAEECDTIAHDCYKFCENLGIYDE